MSDQFNWQIEEEPQEPTPLKSRKGWWGGVLVFWMVAIGVILALLGSWFVSRERSREEKQYLVDTVQEFLDLRRQALLRGDGELYFSLQDSDPNWLVAQLLPSNQKITRAGLQVTNVEQVGETIWVNATWPEQDHILQRIVFLQWRAGQLRQIPTDPNYWGAPLTSDEEWGKLAYRAVDDPWAASIANFVNNAVADVCADNCLADHVPFTLEVRDDFQVTAEPDHLTIPSPRLLGLNSAGKPSARFWNELSRCISVHLTPATIRFAVPPPSSREGETILPYSQLAEQFMASNPGIIIEIVNLDSLPEDLSALALEFDGVALPPTEAMLAAGQVHDLSDFISSDPEFDRSDFYEQVWQGTLWHGRTWFMPEAAEMQVLYYDKAAYDRAEHPEPSSRWTWDEMAQEVTSIVGDQPQPTDLLWGFLDVGLDSLFSYAYNWNNQCSETATVFCQTPLQTENVAAALEWYSQMAKHPGQMPNLAGDLADAFSATQMSTMGDQEARFDEDRLALLLLNFQGSRRKAAIWVDSPLNYEFNLLLSPVGIVPFPGSDRFDGITPLWLRGSFISQQSDRPLAVWQWLKFLSYQAPTPRLVPVRPSVAADTDFWTTLPQPLGDVMRTAFPFARPVTIAEQGMLTWEQVVAVINGEATPRQAAHRQPTNIWFGERAQVNP